MVSLPPFCFLFGLTLWMRLSNLVYSGHDSLEAPELPCGRYMLAA
jgi:hypothetical protein